MNESVFFKTADYTKNKNLIIDDDTVYEVDPICRKEQKQKHKEATSESRIQEKDNMVMGIDIENTVVQNDTESSKNNISGCQWMVMLIWFWYCR